MNTRTFAQNTILKRIGEQLEVVPSFQDYSEHSDYSDYGDYGDSNCDWT